MIDTPFPDDETADYSMMDRIDQICDQFEAELRQDSHPSIEDYIKRVEGPPRIRLLRHLISLELEFTQRDRAVKFAEYFQRFPESTEDLVALQKELDRPAPKRSDRPGIELSGDVTIVPGTSVPELKHFELLNVAGTGGFGTVWRAMDLRLQRIVAVKIPRSERVGQIDMYAVTREARVAAKLRHPNIVSVHEVGEESGTSFIVTDFINGMNLKEWKKSSEINPFDAARLVAKLAVAIQYAHVNGVIHRDLKLANVLMDGNGEPHVADFGLAKREARDDSLAVHGQVLGTPAYMAPEQARADHDSIDRRTDVYSLGVILYELMTGTTPFHGDMPYILQQIVEAPPAAPRSLKTDIPKDLEAICLKCLAKESGKRYETAQALADDLYLFLNGETLRGIPAALPNRLWKWFRRNRRFVAIMGLVAFLVASVSSSFMAWRNYGALPSVPLIPVEFTTEPRGCEITVVAVDPNTGEPDPSKIEKGRKRTPVRMSLAPGDYLVVAVLDAHRFHEVYRHVPAPNETTPFTYRHLRFTRQPSGIVELPAIPIPRPDVTVEMGFCEVAEAVIEPPYKNDPARTWRIPAFYVDRHSVLTNELNDHVVAGVHLPPSGKDQIAINSYFKSVLHLEKVGKRLPSAAELYYLSKIRCPIAENDDPDLPSALPDKTLVYGLHSGRLEWTSTKPGGHFSGAPEIPKSLGIESMSRMIGCDKKEVVESGKNENVETGKNENRILTRTGFRGAREQELVGAIRGVRSTKPRTSYGDFATSTIANKKHD